MTVRTRIAPSPTGFMHIGTLRTVLYDYFLARQNGGQFVVRIEDTDQEREVEGAVEGLLHTLQTLGIEHDEGPYLLPDGGVGEKGLYGPYTQTNRLDIYKKYADQLLAAGHAYHCFCTRETLEEMRTAQTAAKQTPKYDRRCLKLSKEEVEARLAALQPGDAHVVRLHVPVGESVFEDAIRGRISFNNADVDDQVLVKTNGIPTYHLAVVIDDYLMKITHVLRGEEWLSSTPKQIILHNMLGFPMPIYAHVPLLLNADRTKLSKRKGDVAVEQFLAKGYLPETILAFIATLGFNPKADQEIYSMAEMTELFDLSRINKSGAIMNLEKFDWMNKHFLKEMAPAAYLEAARRFVPEAVDHPVMRKAVLVERARISRLEELPAALLGYGDLPEYDGAILVWKKSDASDAKVQLEKLAEFVPTLSDKDFLSPEALELKMKEYTASIGVSAGNVFWPLRVALSGRAQSPSPFEYLYVLGAEEAVKRLKVAIAKL